MSMVPSHEMSFYNMGPVYGIKELISIPLIAL